MITIKFMHMIPKLISTANNYESSVITNKLLHAKYGLYISFVL